jgi:hypothetical protein
MKTTTKKPTHRVYAVTRHNNQNYWREIGAAWAHSDGEGFGLKLDYLPLNSAEIVIRKPRAADKAEGEEGGAQ